MLATGADGYRQATKEILETAATIREGIRAIPGLRVLGDPLWVIAFGSDDFDIFRVLDEMGKRGWHLNGLHRPTALHIAVTRRHCQPGVAERFLADPAGSVAAVEANPEAEGGRAPVYGMAATLPLRGVAGERLRRYIDRLSTV